MLDLTVECDSVLICNKEYPATQPQAVVMFIWVSIHVIVSMHAHSGVYIHLHSCSNFLIGIQVVWQSFPYLVQSKSL